MTCIVLKCRLCMNNLCNACKVSAPIELETDRTFSDIFTTSQSKTSYFLSSDRIRVFGCGNNEYNQINPTASPKIFFLTSVFISSTAYFENPYQVLINQAFPSGSHSIILDTSGKVYSMGSSALCEVGTGKVSPGVMFYPEQTPFTIPGEVQRVIRY